ncbi:MAG: HAMP domain-containing histidine kinase [Deltaproteobacteria bacterium]|nr:HAMP domain-containing histidine kinase [Deltaproteobacteria bacterium]
MRLSQFITTFAERIIGEWEEFARTCLPAGSLIERRDHVALMLKAIAIDLETPQSDHEQSEKGKGKGDSAVSDSTAANAHGTDRAASGYTPVQMVSEFRALRASVLRLFAEEQTEFGRDNLEDVTRFNEAIDQALAESMATYAAGVDRSKDLFLGVLGHDLRNPLGAIMMATTVMLTQEGAAWAHAKTAGRILTSATRMEEMIGDLLDFTRTRLGGGIPVVPEKMDLEELCQQTVDEIVAFHPRRVVRIDAGGQLHGMWDRGRIGQVLSNLIGNAHQHGSRSAPVDVVLRGEADRVVLTVHNQGTVIDPDHLGDIFDPFRKALGDRAVPKATGSIGLGLYIVRAIVAAHDGTIAVESMESGTTFKVTLPRKMAAVRATEGA